MSDEKTKKEPRFFARGVDKVNDTEADFYIEAPYTPGPRSTSPIRHLVVSYDKAVAKLHYPVGGDGRPQFATGIPDHWTDDMIMNAIMEIAVDVSRNFDSKN
jgi:hypothetical protein